MKKKFFHPTVYYNPFNKKYRLELIVVTEDANGLLSASFASADEIAEYESMKNVNMQLCNNDLITQITIS